MSWVRLDDAFADHPKLTAAGPTAALVYVWGLCYCARQLTDGFMPAEALKGCPWVSTKSERERTVDRLIDAKLWKRVRAGGFRIPDYLEYNPSRKKVLEERRRNADRQARWRERQQAKSNAPRNAVTNAAPHPAPKGAGGRAAGAPLGGARRLVEDDCMRCSEVRPLHEFKGNLWCMPCVLAYGGELEHDLREHIQTLRVAS